VLSLISFRCGSITRSNGVNKLTAGVDSKPAAFAGAVQVLHALAAQVAVPDRADAQALNPDRVKGQAILVALRAQQAGPEATISHRAPPLPDFWRVFACTG
jgi:hypothetical protein